MSFEGEIRELVMKKVEEHIESMTDMISEEYLLDVCRDQIKKMLDPNERNSWHNRFSEKVVFTIADEVARKFAEDHYQHLINDIDLKTLSKLIHIGVSTQVRNTVK